MNPGLLQKQYVSDAIASHRTTSLAQGTFFSLFFFLSNGYYILQLHCKISCNPGPHTICMNLCTGPLVAEPFTSPLLFAVTSALTQNKDASIFSSLCPSLLITTARWTFLNCGHHQVTHTSSKKSVQPSLGSLHRNDI